jgi:uncharacterized protein (DUF433 family)
MSVGGLPRSFRPASKAGGIVVVGDEFASVDEARATAWEKLDVESISGKRSGAWVFRDTRTPVSVVFDNPEVGASIDEIMEWFHLSRDQVVSVTEFAARSLDAPPILSPFTQIADAHPV